MDRHAAGVEVHISPSESDSLKTRRNFLSRIAAAGVASAPAMLMGAPHGPNAEANQPEPGTSEIFTMIVPLDGTDWLLATDPHNEGREQRWWEDPRKDAWRAKVPWVIQGLFPDYHGVAWYWRDFIAPANPHRGGLYLLRFHLVDYLGEAWVNGTPIGNHEGGEEPFVLDATTAVEPNGKNRLAVRVLNPTHEPIDGIALAGVAEGRREYPKPRDNAYNTGGIVGAVELLLTPPLHIEDLHVIPDWKTGEVRVRVNVRNAGDAVPGRLALAVAPAVSGEPVVARAVEQRFSTGDRLVEAVLQVEHHHLWELNDPFLYRVTARVEARGTGSVDERSTRCGFRDFRFEDGYFRFNGRRIRLHGPLYTTLQYPIAQIIPYDEDLLRRDALNMKAMGFNIVRITCGPALPRQLDLFDELGLLAYEEPYGARALAESPHLEKRWDASVGGVVRRDRNHPSIVIWGMLNEVPDGRLFRHAVKALQLVRDLDETRLVLLNSGRFDKDYSIGSLSNPGSLNWENLLRDVHAYPLFPHSAETIKGMRNSQLGGMPGVFPGAAQQPILLSEYGVCGGQDYLRFVRHFEELGAEQAPDARLFREKLDSFLVDWNKWRLDGCWARPEDYFRQSQKTQAKLALDDYNAWLANPELVGDLTSTQITDAWFHGCGIANYFRELKPAMADAYNDMAAPVRWCLFVEPVNVSRGSTVRLEAVLVNHDALKPGKYPVRLQVVGPKAVRLFEKRVELEVSETASRPELPFARRIFSEELALDCPSGNYQFLATFERGAAAGGGQAEFYVTDLADLPAVSNEITLWGEDAELADWLRKRGLRVRRFATNPSHREVILVSGDPPAGTGAEAFAELARHLARGSAAVFLTYSTLLDRQTAAKPAPAWERKAPVPLRWAPFSFAAKPSLGDVPTWYFRADHWAKDHPIFEGLPCGGILDYTFYREILSADVFVGLQPPLEAVSGALDTSESYHSVLLVSVHDFGEGRFTLNSLKIRENLGRVPAAEHLLRNMLNYMARDLDKPLAGLPAGFDAQLASLGYSERPGATD